MYKERQRPFLGLVSHAPHYLMKVAYQKLFGLYLLATRRMAIFESPSMGYTP